jgi:ABC-type branched-subunit amino acid transport system substrate-binding protein
MAVAGFIATASVAGCSSSGGSSQISTGSSSAGSTASAGSAATGGFASPNITFMNIADTASSTLSLPQSVTGAQAGVAEINSTGGINGHKVVLFTCNSQADPNVAASCGRMAVADHVSAVIGAVSLQSDAFNAVLAQAGIPSVGNIAIGKLDVSSPISFPFNSGEMNQLGNVVGMPGYQRCKKPAEIVANDPAATVPGQDIVAYYKAAAQSAAPVRVVSVPLATTAMTSPVAAALAGGTDCLFLIADETTTAAGIKAVAATDAHVRMTVAAVTAPEMAVLGTAADGLYTDGEFLQPGTAGGEQFAKEMTAIDPSAAQDPTAETAYTGALVLAAAAKQAKLTSFTAKDFLRAMNEARDITVPTIGTLSGFPADSGISGLPRVNDTQVYTYQWNNGKFNLVSDKPTDVGPALRIVHPS